MNVYVVGTINEVIKHCLNVIELTVAKITIMTASQT